MPRQYIIKDKTLHYHNPSGTGPEVKQDMDVFALSNLLEYSIEFIPVGKQYEGLARFLLDNFDISLKKEWLIEKGR